MNIGIFTDTFEPCTNGVVDSVWRVCKGFQKEGHNVHLFALSDRDDDELRDGIHIHKFKAKRFKFYPDYLIRFSLPLKRVFRIINKEKIEVLHSNLNLCMGTCALIASFVKKISLITTYHTMIPEFIECFIRSWDDGSIKKPFLFKVLEKIKLAKPTVWLSKKFVWYWMHYFNNSKWLIVPSNYTKKVLIKHGLSKDKIIVVPNPINHSNSIKIKKKKKNLILHVGRLSSEKKVDVLIKALKYVKHPVKVLITSDGPLKDYLKSLAVKEGVADKIKFTGFVSRRTLIKYYDESSLFVSAAEHDTFNMCVAEALVHGTPVIISKNSGATDFVKQGKNGFIINSGKPIDYAKKIDWLLANKKARQSFSKAGEEIKEYTSINNIIKKIEYLYNNFNKDNFFYKLKNLLIYGIGALFSYGVIIIGSLLERNKSQSN